VSSVAQAAGLAALTEEDYLLRTKALIARERTFLTEQLTALGLRVLGSQANYIFFHAPISDLPERLLPRGVLIRSCANYPGLDAAYCRIAVRTRAENERLLAALAPALSER
ncbi:MAG: aminotransferase class I/II-fold pyridoxal phosphate-dependent enzyme, partial [Oscillospiraceae bacterium]